MRGSNWGALCLLLVACSGTDAPAPLLACVDGDVRCGATCSESDPCAAGLYCTDGGTCAKQCVAADGASCSNGGVCTASGKCLEPVSAGSGGSGGAPNGGRGAFAGSSGSAGGAPVCAQTKVSTKRVQPTVILIVDQSGSMGADFGTSNRWDVLRDSLLARPGGLIASLQSQVKFGFALYSADSNPDNDNNGPPAVVGQCPAVQSVAPALNNYDEIEDLYGDADWLDDTPTGDSINHILDSLDLDEHPSTATNPIVFVLATDGEPDRCENLDPSGAGEQAMARMEAVAAVQRAFQHDIRTYLISVGAQISATHMAEMANAGIGRGAGEPPADYWEPTNDQSLRSALTEIIGGEVSCDITLDGEVQGNHCLGSVELDGKKLSCDDPNGWELTDAKHIRLLGTACTQLKNDADATLDVSFPCEVQIVVPQ